jgi:hypothetical protein
VRDYLGTLALRTVNPFFVVFANGHSDCESLVAFLAVIFVKGHRGVSFLYDTKKIEELEPRN